MPVRAVSLVRNGDSGGGDATAVEPSPPRKPLILREWNFQNGFPSCLGGEHRAEAVPPKSDRLMADIDPSLVQQILDISKGKWKPHIDHHHKADDLRRGSKIPKRATSCHPSNEGGRPARLKPIPSDNAV